MLISSISAGVTSGNVSLGDTTEAVSPGAVSENVTHDIQEDWQSIVDDEVQTDPALDNDTVYFGTSSGTVYSYRSSEVHCW